ncbi:AAA family ATPase [Streptomyces sp. TLI_146]|uniref:AAA family ATPase n=1 Tax=Streptomyces sp. TLI_146 TaxID=1938858 RepID=UPI000C709D65|nr:AAA family ATPase [Streptomyces sp. TLI_146]PKV83420.1 DNA-binding NarL/FixJ family response regulator [Streptomyces sp. TLI_146]
MSGPFRAREHDGAHALVAAEVERARSGAGGLVVLRGATGTGRTAVLEAAAGHAAEQGLRVLRVRCSSEDTAVPFAAVRHLLDPVPEFTDVAPGADGRADAARLWRLLCSYAAERPLLLAVDDVHLADDASRHWMREAARHIDRLPVLVVATERSQYDIEPRSAGLTQSLSPSLVRTHTLGPLGDRAAAELVRAAFPTAGPGWTAACVRAAAGSPLLLHALLDDLGGAPQDGLSARGEPPLPETCAALYPGSYPAAVSWWLHSAGPATADVARCLAALEQAWPTDPADPTVGGPADRGASDPVHLLAEATGADPVRIAGWLAAMTRLGLLRPDAVGRPRYAHPLLHDAVLTGWPETSRQAAHRAAAQAMLRRGERAESIARHLLRVPGGEPPWALRVLRDAVTVAVHDARPDDAVGYLRRALDEPLPDALRQRLLTELGSLHYASADAPAAIARLAEAQHLAAEPRSRVRTAVALGTALVDRGEVRTALEVLRRTEGQLSGHPDLARTVQTAAALLSDGDPATRQQVYRWLCEAADTSPDLVGTAGQALLVRFESTAALISAQEAMGRIRDLLARPTDSLAEPFLLGTAAAVAQWADELDEADRLVDLGLAGQRAVLLHPMRHALLNTRADIAAARGDAAALLAAHFGTDPVGGPVESLPGPSNRDATALLALVHAGRIEDAQRYAAGFDLRGTAENFELNRFLYARGVLRVTAGDPAGALHDFLECGRRQSARDVVSPVVTPWRTAAAQCRLALGGGPDAVTLAAEELRLARVWNTPRTVGRALRVLGAATGGRRGLELAEEAVATLRPASAATGMELVRALLAQGRQLAAAGERGRARDCLREAAELADGKGAVGMVNLAGQALRQSGARSPVVDRTGPGALTGSERRIAELAADGLTNTEIADLLHLARRTVETHLTSTYRKLRIRRRTALAEALDGDRPGDTSGTARPTAPSGR